MKLNRDAFVKTDYQDGKLYQYTCNDTDFFLYVKGKGQDKEMSVFKGKVDDRQDEFNTSDTLEAWSKFEEMLKECEPQQGSSGGFAKNPQQNPNILPLLAIKRNEGTGMFSVKLFAVVDKQQVVAMEFEVSSDALPYPYPTKVFVVDWQNEEIPTLFKCDILMKKYGDVEFEEDKEADVFLFIPKSIMTQGGEEGGNADQSQPSISEGGEPQEGEEAEGGEPQEDQEPQEGDEPSEGGDEGEEDEGEPEEDEETDEPSGGGDEGGEPTNEPIEGRTPVEDEPINFGETITRLSELTNTQPSLITNVFRTVSNGETWLLLNNFSKIKQDLNLPANITAREFSQQIINSR